MDTTPKEPPAHAADAKPSPVHVREPETPEARKRRMESAPSDPHQPIEEPGYGHGV